MDSTKVSVTLRVGSFCSWFSSPLRFSQYSFVQAVYGRQVPPKDATFAGLPSVVHHPEPGVENLGRHKRVLGYIYTAGAWL